MCKLSEFHLLPYTVLQVAEDTNDLKAGLKS